ncbi:MAG: sugar phosphate nucleotidyltransferase [Bacteriovoracaceae bacterium]
MSIDHCLILAAGFGTRMGEIGKHLPKVLWPFFETTLLELQINFAKFLKIKNIFVNVHFQSEQIIDYLTSRKLIPKENILFEKEILDIGGAIYNLANQPPINYAGKLLVLNSDLFYFFDEVFLNKIAATDFRVKLLTVEVPNNQQYNETVINANGELVGINKSPNYSTNTKDILTYSGLCLVNLAKLERNSGKLSFFESVANYKNYSIGTHKLTCTNYWDFGTFQRYYQSIRQVLENIKNGSNDDFINYCLKNRQINLNNINDTFLNFSENKFDKSLVTSNGVIVLKRDQTVKSNMQYNAPGIYWNEIFIPI